MSTIKFLFFVALFAVLIVVASPLYLQNLKEYPKLQAWISVLHERFEQAPIWQNIRYFPMGIADVSHPIWSPDGQKLVVAVGHLTLGFKKVWTVDEVDVSSRTVKRIGNYAGPDRVEKVVFSSHGDYLAVQFAHEDGVGSPYLELMNYQTHVFIPIPLPAGSSFHSEEIADTKLAFLPDGKKLLFSASDGKQSRLCVYDFGTGESGILPLAMDIPEGVWAPAGNKILFVARQGTNASIFTADPDGGNPSVLHEDGFNFSPRYSPYSDKVAFLQSQNDSSALGIVRLDKNEIDFVRGLPRRVSSLHWSPDASQIFFQAENDKNQQVIYVYSLSLQKVRRLFEGANNRDPDPDPQGQRLAFVSDRSIPGLFSLYQATSEGGEPERLTGWFIR